MSHIFVRGVGAVCPGGWGIAALRDALAASAPIPTKELARPGWTHALCVRPVPAPAVRPKFLVHPRLRRTSPISQYAVAAALEALGGDNPERIGIVLCVMSGCVNYSRRFYEEVLRDPSTASPLVFPETVFNAPSSHLASLLGSRALNYTLVGDPGTFLQGIALAAQWLEEENLDGCLVVGAEEIDWLTADAYRIFSRQMVLADGAGAIYLSRQPVQRVVSLLEITDSHPFHDQKTQLSAALRMRSQLHSLDTDLLCDSRTGVPRLDRAELKAWNSWAGRRLSPKVLLGEGLMAAAGWQVAAAIDALAAGQGATISVVGCNQQVVGARFAST